MDPTRYLQEAQRRLNRMSEGSATAVDYAQYAKAYRALKRQRYQIPEEWPRPPEEMVEKAKLSGYPTKK